MKKKIVENENQTEFDKLLAASDLTMPQVGDVVLCKVLAASKTEVKLDINGILTGVVRGRELYSEADEYAKLKPGDEIEATVVDAENENGELELSFRQAGQEKTWQSLEDTMNNKTTVKVKVVDANRGGLLVIYLQVPGFLPVSQLSPENYPRISGGDKSKILEKLKSLVGLDLEVKVISLDRKEQKLVVSEKDAWQEAKKDLMSQYQIGNAVEGTITAITNFGVFVNFGDNLEGLIHISELAWQRIEDPFELYKVGDKIKAEIISIDGSKIFLSAKRLLTDPWKEIAAKYQVSQIVKGTILKINPYGLFVELDKDIHGLAHISQCGLSAGQRLSTAFKIGEVIDFRIVSIEAGDHRLGLEVPHEEAEAKTAAESPELVEGVVEDEEKPKKKAKKVKEENEETVEERLEAGS